MHFITFMVLSVTFVSALAILQRPEKQRQIRDAWRLFWLRNMRRPKQPRQARPPHWRVRLAIWYVKHYGRSVLRHLLKLGICALIFWATYQTLWWLDRSGLLYSDNTFTTQTDEP